MRREKGLRAINPERRRLLFERQFGSKERTRFIRDFPCATCTNSKRLTQCSHVKSRGAGGGPDDMIPQCYQCHHELHQIGLEAFEQKHQVDLVKLARRDSDLWRKRASAE